MARQADIFIGGNVGGIKGWRIHGIEEVTGRINAVLKKMEGASAAGLIRAANYVLNDATKTSPTVPLDTGILRASRFIGPTQFEHRKDIERLRSSYKAGGTTGVEVSESTSDKLHGGSGKSTRGENGNVYVVFGYTASYAAAVHEMIQSPSGEPINWTTPGTGAKFLEYSLKRNEQIIITIIAGSVRSTS